MSEETRHPLERAIRAWNNSPFGWVINTLMGVVFLLLAVKLFVWAVTL